MLKRVLVLFALCAIATVPLAQGAANQEDPGTATVPGTTIGSTDTTSMTTPPATTTAPPAPTGVIAEGVTIAGVPVGGMNAEQAAAAVQLAFEEPVQFSFKKRHWWAEPDRLGAKAYVTGAVQRALSAAPGTVVSLVVTVKGALVDEYVDYLNRNFARTAKDSTMRLVKLKPRISKARDGFDVDDKAMRTAIVRALKTLPRTPIELQGKVIEPKLTLSSYGSIIVIRRGSNKLYLYNGQRFVRSFGVATGQASYPTPLGRFTIVNKQENPWWYPPTGSDWAKDEQPVPPGPTNPLGTRWMGLSAPLIGIHGTPNSYSIGYSASHGCIRMLVPEAEWLFNHVEIGTTVFIVGA